LLVAALSVAGLGLYAFWLEPSSIRLARYDVPGNPASFKDLSIAVIADLHAGSTYIGEAKIDRVVTLTNAAKPDLILLTGDYVRSVSRSLGGRHIPIAVIARHLKPLRAPLGVYAVIGNHDRWEDAGSVAAAFGAAGITVLENRNVTLSTARGPVHLAGIGDLYTKAHDPGRALSGIAADAPVLCFTHTPDLFPQLPPACALTITGHTHGGQVRLPFIGRPIVPSGYGRRYAAGYIREGRKALFVSTGIGTSMLPVRFGVPPEVTFLRLE
jgi:predicted MPP superfamily phosphohydrolase